MEDFVRFIGTGGARVVVAAYDGMKPESWKDTGEWECVTRDDGPHSEPEGIRPSGPSR